MQVYSYLIDVGRDLVLENHDLLVFHPNITFHSEDTIHSEDTSWANPYENRLSYNQRSE
jgi:hypothetical protein